jgi:hypothetical protein
MTIPDTPHQTRPDRRLMVACADDHRDCLQSMRRVAAVRLSCRTDERAWRIGAVGEEAVAKRLEGFGAGWRVLHSVPVGKRGSDIDHLVIGPGGV